MTRLRQLGLVLIVSVLVGGCSTMDLKPVYSADGPSVIIVSRDVSRIKAAILGQTSAEHFKLDINSDAREHLEVSRRLSMLKVLLLTESIAGKNDREILSFHIEAVDAGTRVYASRIEQMGLPGGGFNRDPLMDKDQYMALQMLLEKVKRQIERDPGDQANPGGQVEKIDRDDISSSAYG